MGTLNPSFTIGQQEPRARNYGPVTFVAPCSSCGRVNLWIVGTRHLVCVSCGGASENMELPAPGKFCPPHTNPIFTTDEKPMSVKQKLHEAAVSLTEAKDALENVADWSGLDHVDSVLDHLYLVQKQHAATENKSRTYAPADES